MSEQITVKIAVAGEVREVTADITPAGHAITGDIFAATIGRGAARYSSPVLLWPVQDGKVHGGCKVTTDEQGRQWQYHLQTCVRNRQARIVGFVATVGLTNHVGQARY